MSNIPEKNL